jgi:hypothetical protein
MAYFQSPIAFQLQSFTNQGLILSGGLIYTYLAGTTTLQNTYTDSTGTVLNSNPIVLDSSGRLTTSIWVTGGVSLKVIIKDSSNNTLATVDNISGINDITLALASPGTIGGTTPGAATFTTVTANTSVTSAVGNFTTLASTTLSGNLTVTGNSTLGNNPSSDTVSLNGWTGIGTTGGSPHQCFILAKDSSTSYYALTIYDPGNTNLLFRLRNDGNITFGSTSAGGPYNATTASAANLFITSGGVLQRSTSSARYKKDITDATHGLSEVLKLRPVKYRGVNDGDTWFGGLLAEDLHSLGLTEFVQYDEQGRPDAISYGPMVSLMAKAIQQLTARVEALEAAAQPVPSGV